MWKLLERFLGWTQNVGRAGEEIDALKARMARLEEEMKRRPGPDFCPKCNADLVCPRTEAIKSATMGHQFAEDRFYECARCDYRRTQRITFPD